MEETKDKIKSVKYISLKEASDLCSYSQDYLSLRARQGKLKAVKMGRNWVTREEWVKEYIKQIEGFNKNLSKTSKPLISEATKDDIREIKEILKSDLLIIPSLLKAGYIKLKGIELDFNDLTNFFKNLFVQFGRLASKAPILISQIASWAEQTGKKNKLRHSQLPNLLGRLAFVLEQKNRELHYSAARLLENLKTCQGKICRPKFVLSAFLITLMLFGSIFFFNADARASLAKWADISTNALSDAKKETADFVYQQGENIITAIRGARVSIKNVGSEIINSSASAVSQAPQFIEETTQNIEELPFLIYSSVSRAIPAIEMGIETGVSGLKRVSKGVLTATNRLPGRIISFSYDSKHAFERASQKNEQLKFALKSKSGRVFNEFQLKISNLPNQIAEIALKAENLPTQISKLARNLSQNAKQTTRLALTLPRQISQWGIGQAILSLRGVHDAAISLFDSGTGLLRSARNDGEEFLALCHPERLAKDLSQTLAQYSSEILQSATSFRMTTGDFFKTTVSGGLSDISDKLSDTLSDMPENVANKANNAFLSLKKSTDQKRFSLSLKLDEARLITSLTLDEMENIVIARPTKAVKTGFETADEAQANLFDSIGEFGKKTVQISKKVKNKLGDAYIKVAEFVIPGYSIEERGQLLPQKTTITKIGEPIVQKVVTKEITKEITKEKITEVTETVQSADLTEINQDIDDLSLRITNLANQISSRIDYTTPSYAPIYIPSSGIQVAGHALLTTLNVSGSGSVGGSLSVRGNTGFGDPSISTDTFDVYSTATFSEATTFDSSVSAASLGASGDLTIGGNGTVSGTFSAATTTLSQLTITNDLLVSGNATTTGSQAFLHTIEQTASSTSPIFSIIASSTETHLLFKLAGAGPFLNITDNTDISKLYIQNDGNLGIGTTTPDSKLTVVGRMHASSTSEQLRLTYDLESSKYASFTIDANGDLNIDLATGNSTTTISDNLSVLGYLNIEGSATTTGSQYVKKDLTVDGTSIFNGDITQTGNLNITGYASTTLGLFTQFNIHAGGTFSADGIATLNNNLIVVGTSDFQGNIADSLGDLTIDDNLSITGNATTTGSFTVGTDYLFVDKDSGYIGIGTSSPSVILAIDSTNAVVLPVGTDAQRPSAAYTGMIRYNTDASQFEGYSSSNWTGLGGVIDVDRNTYILAESTPGANEDILFFYIGGTEKLRIATDGNLGIGTTTPDSKLTVIGRIHASSTSEQLRLTYDLESDKYASFTIDTNGDLKIDLATGNSTTTISDNLSVLGYLNVEGSATTTGSLYIGADLTVLGFASTTAGLFTQGDGHIGGSLTVDGNATIIGGTLSDTLTINSTINSNLIPDQNATRDLGSPSYYWDDVYVDQLVANNISAASTTIAGTQSETFTINSNNATADTESQDLIFFRGTVVPNALLTWDSTLDRFDINQPVFIQNDSSTTTVVALDIKGKSGQTADLFRISSSSADSFFVINSDGNLGIGTTTPDSALTTIGRMHASSTSEQLRLTYDLESSKYASFTIDSNGDLNIDLATGNSTTTISDNLSVLGYLNIEGNATTTGSQYVGGDFLASGTGSFASAKLSIDASGNLTTTGYASTTTYLNTQGTLHVGSNASIDGTLNVLGATTLSDNLNMQNYIITNIGNSGTDFDTNGGLTLASNLQVNGSATTTGSFYVGTDRLVVTEGGYVGIGTTTPDSKLTVIGRIHASSTTEQLRLTYDLESSKYASFTIDANGDLTIDLATTNSTTTISDNLSVLGYLNVEGSATTTGSQYLGGDFLASGTGSFASAKLSIDASGNLTTTGYASTTTYLNTQGDLHVGGNASIDGTLNVLGATTFSDNLNMQNYIITNIGNAETDFDTNGGLTLAGDLTVNANASTTGYLSIGGDDGADNDILYFDTREENLTWDNSNSYFSLTDDLVITGYASTTEGLFTLGEIRTAGNLTADGNLLINANATTTGSHYIGGDLGILGNASTTGSINVDQNLTVDGTGSFALAKLSIDASGNLTTTGYASTTTYLNTQGDLHIGGNASIDGTLDVLGATTLSGNLNITGYASTTVGLYTQGEGHFGTNLTVDGNATTTGRFTISASKPETLVTITQSGAGDALSVTGTTTLAGNLVPATDNTYDIGTSTLRWRELNLGPDSLNIWTRTGDNWEKASMKFKDDVASDVFTIATEEGGTGQIRDIQIKTGSNNGIYLDSSGYVGIGYTNPGTTLNVNGLVGIGTTAPTSHLDILANGRATGNIKYGMRVVNTDTANTQSTRIAFIGNSSNSWIVGTDSNDNNTNQFFISTTTPDSTPPFAITSDGNIYLGDSVTPSVSTNKLYSIAGDLIWNGTSLTGGVTNYWDRTGSNMYLNTITDNIGIGTTTPDSKLTVIGRMHASSTSEQLRLSYDDSTSKYGSFTIDTNGDLTIDLATANATTTFSDNVQINGNLGGGSPLNIVTDVITYGSATTTDRLVIGTTNPTTDDMLFIGGNAFLTGYASSTTGLFTQGNARIGGSATTTGSFYVGTSNLVVTEGGNVGIGTTSPNARLEIGGGADTTARLRFSYNPAPTVYYGEIYLDPTGATEGMVFNVSNEVDWFAFTGGNVGIGTTSPGSNRLYISAPIANLPKIEVTSSNTASMNGGLQIMKTTSGDMADGFGTTLDFQIQDATSGVQEAVYIGAVRSGADNSASFIVKTNNAGSVTEKMRVTNDGNVGIGTTGPGAKLEVSGAHTNYSTSFVRLTSTDAAGQLPLDFYINGTRRGRIRADYVGNFHLSAQGGNLNFMTGGDADSGGTIKMALLPLGGLSLGNGYIGTDPGTGNMIIQGNVGIGTTGPNKKLEISVDSASHLQLRRDSDDYWDIVVGADAIGDNILAFQKNGATDNLVIEGTGNVGINDGTPTYKLDVNGTIRGFTITDSSDVRWKKNIVTLDSTLDKINQLRGVYYDWRVDEYPELSLSTSTQIGIIAQELELQYPELVDTDNEGFKSIQYGKLSSVLLQGIKELNTKVDLITGTSTDFSNLALYGTTTVSNLNISNNLCFGGECKTSWDDIVFSGNTDNWNTAYGWGDHSTAGYLTEYTELDPIFAASASASITSASTTNWQTSYGWGNHSQAGYIAPANTGTDGHVLSLVNGSPTWVATSTLRFSGTSTTTINNYYSSTTAQVLVDLADVDLATGAYGKILMGTGSGWTEVATSSLGITVAPSELDVYGNIMPSANNTYDIGSPTNKFANIYANNLVAGDLTFTETTSAVSGDTFVAGDVLSLYVTSTGADTHTVPIDFRTAINTANYGAGNIHFNTTGNMGLGFASSTAPAGKLHIYTSKTTGDFRLLTLQNYQGDGNISYQMSINNTDGNLQFTSNDNSQGSLINSSYSAWNLTIGGADDYWGIKRSPTGSLSYADVLRITNTGNVGIGTTTPQASLHITDTAGGTTDYLFMVSTTTNAGSSEYFSISADGNIAQTGNLDITGYASTTAGLYTQGEGHFGTNLTIDGNATTTGSFAIGDSSKYGFFEIDSNGNLQIDLNTANATTTFLDNVEITGNLSGSSPLNITGGANITGGNVGIGTTTPKYNLSIEGTTGNLLQIATTTNQGIFVINSAGNVGIGTASPGAKLDIRNTDYSALFLTSDAVTHPATGWLATNAYARLGMASLTAGGLLLNGISDTDATGIAVEGYIGASDPTDTIPAVSIAGGKSNGGTGRSILGNLETVLRIKNYNVDLVTVLGSGNVGIGTTTPGAKLDVVSRVRTISGTTATYMDAQTGYGQLSVYNTGGGGLPLALQMDGGNVGIGTTTPDAPLEVYRNQARTSMTGTAFGTLHLDAGETSTYITSLTMAQNSNRPISIIGTKTDVILGSTMFFGTSNNYASGITNTAMAIRYDGNVGIGDTTPSYQLELSTDSAAKPTTNTWTIASDARLKTNVQDFTDGLDVIKNIRPVTYEYNNKGGFTEDGSMKVSIIAQELQPYAPYMIGSYTGELDGVETELLNYQGHALAFVMVNAIQEITDIINMTDAPTITPSMVIDSAGNIGMSGDVQIEGSATTTGSMYIAGDLTVDGLALFQGQPLGINNWNQTYSWGDHTAAGYLTSYTETDPLFASSTAANITSTNTTNWNLAYNWGDHSAQNYFVKGTDILSDIASGLYYTDGNLGIGTTTTSTPGRMSARLLIQGEGIASSTNALSIINASSSPLLLLTNNGNVGIATTSPTNILTIGQGKGNAIADGWEVYSSREYKTDITYLEDEDYAALLEEIEGVDVATYRWKKDVEDADEGSPLNAEGSPLAMQTNLGIIAEEAPERVLSQDGKSVSLYDYATFAIAGVKAVNRELKELEALLTVEKDENGQLVEIDPLGELKARLAELGLVLDEEGVLVVDKIKAKNIETENLKVGGGVEEQAGITLYDRITREPYCFFVASGVSQTVAGECGAEVEESQDQTLEPIVEEPVVEEESMSDLSTPTSDEVEESQDQTLEPVEEPVVEEPVVEEVIEEPVIEEVETPPADAVNTPASVDTASDNAI